MMNIRFKYFRIFSLVLALIVYVFTPLILVRADASYGTIHEGSISSFYFYTGYPY